jgi:hypothetical protein
MIDLIIKEYATKDSPTYFAQDFGEEFSTINDPACQHLFILTEKDLVHVGDRGFFDMVNSAGDVFEGLKTAYDHYRSNMSSVRVTSLDDALRHLQCGSLTRGDTGGCIALSTKHQHQKIMARAVFDVDAFQRSQFFIGDLEIRLANHKQHIPSFFAYLLKPNVFDIISS